MKTRLVALLLFATVLLLPALAQDAVQIDPKHYTVLFENDQVRVLRITYGPGEKSVMHHHPDSVAVFLTDQHVRFGLPDGKSEIVEAKKGSARFIAGGNHVPENVSDAPLEVILVELKHK